MKCVLRASVLLMAVAAMSVVGCTQAKSAGAASSGGGETSPKPASGAKIMWSDSTYQFGRMDQQQKNKHEFEIRNEGTEDLIVQFVHRSCGCSELKLKDFVWQTTITDDMDIDETKVKEPLPTQTVTLAPGEKANLEFAWNTRMKVGKIRITTTLATNDPKHPEVTFGVEGEVVPFVNLTRNTVELIDQRNGQPATATFDVFSVELDNLEVTEIVSSNEKITAQAVPMDKDQLAPMQAKSGHRVTVQLAPGMPIGPFNAKLNVRTNFEHRPDYAVVVFGRVQGDVIMTPFEELNFTQVKVSDGGTLKLFVKIRSQEAVEAKIKSVTPEFLKCELKPIENETGRNFYRLTAQVPAGAPGGVFKGLIELETTHPAANVVKIPVRGTVVQ